MRAGQPDGDGFEIVAFGQGYASTTWPTKKLEDVVLSIEMDAADDWFAAHHRWPNVNSGLIPGTIDDTWARIILGTHFCIGRSGIGSYGAWLVCRFTP